MKTNIKEVVKALNPAVNAYLLARTHAEVWRERMEEWDRAELARFEYWTDPKISREPRCRVMDPHDVYEMCEDDATEFYQTRQEYVTSLKVKGLSFGSCPALVAECVQRDTAHSLIEIAAKTIPACAGVTLNGLLCCKNGLETYQKFIDLVVGLVVNAPGYRAPKLAA